MVHKTGLLAAVVLLGAGAASGQSTFGVILGDVRDATGAAIRDATVRITQTAQNVSRETRSGDDGSYEFQNVLPGPYQVTVTAPGFKTYTTAGLELAARGRLRVDATLEVGELTQSIEVSTTAGVIATDTPAIASTLTLEKVLNLPTNVRGAGSTSPYAMLQVLPGVQADNGLNLSVQGGLPAQIETTVDGISITQVRNNTPNRDLFPSVESIGELRVQGAGNTAEYGQPGDITVISKSGTNQAHGALFWYHQNRALDARSFGQATLPSKVGNTFGATLGGPVYLPKVYDGRNRTFFYFTWESMRFPRQGTIQNTVPTQFVRAGDFNREGVTVRDPFTGQPFPGNVIPENRIHPVAKAVLPFYPLPNTGSGDRRASGNYRDNRSTSVDSDQYEGRADQHLGDKHAVFARVFYKNNPVLSPNNLLLPNDTLANKFWQGTASWTYTIRPNLLNEFRFGHVRSDASRVFNFDGRSFTNSLNLKDIQRDIFFNGLPNFSIDLYTSFAKGRPGFTFSTTSQILDNLTWVRGAHTFKFGFEVRKLRSVSDLGFTTGNNYGDFFFTGAFSGDPFADFLLGVPSRTGIAVVSQDNDGRATHYKAYVQDTIRVSSKLTVDVGVRYELQPGFTDAGLNIANFDPRIARTGRVVLMSDPKARHFVAPGTLLSVNACPGPEIEGIGCTPFVTAREVGLPEGLRETYKTEFLPRLGFAYRLNPKTTVRGSGGVYNMLLLGSVFFSLTGTVQTDVRLFNNIGADGRPIFVLPETRTPGSGVLGGSLGTFEFRTANAIEFKPPHMLQWGLSVDRELTATTGVRISYIGNRSYQLPWAPDINMMAPSTRFFSQRSRLERPFPNWGLIFTRAPGANALYNSLQVEVNRRFAQGLTFGAAYTLAKNLADNAGPNPSGFAGETGGGRVTNSLNRRGDRGDVYATRRHRFLNTFVWQLPFGKGRRWLSGAGGLGGAVLGGWQLAGVLTLQSGPYLTPVFSGSGDPSGSGAPTRGAQRPDRIGSGALENPTRERWLDRNAFVCPGRSPGPLQFNCNVGAVPGRDPAPIGRFGNSGVGILTGPGTFALNAALSKKFSLREGLDLRLEGSFTNLPNWTNLADPNLNIADSNFGRITSARGVDFGGGRTGQVSLRLEF